MNKLNNVCFYICLFWQKKKLTRNHLTKHHWAFCINLNFICIWGYIEQSFWWVFIILMIKTWPPWSIMYKHVWRSSCYCTLDLFWWIQWILLPSSPSYLSVTTGGRLYRNFLYVQLCQMKMAPSVNKYYWNEVYLTGQNLT